MWGVLHHEEQQSPSRSVQSLPEIGEAQKVSPRSYKSPHVPSTHRRPRAGVVRPIGQAHQSSLVSPGVMHALTPPLTPEEASPLSSPKRKGTSESADQFRGDVAEASAYGREALARVRLLAREHHDNLEVARREHQDEMRELRNEIRERLREIEERARDSIREDSARVVRSSKEMAELRAMLEATRTEMSRRRHPMDEEVGEVIKSAYRSADEAKRLAASGAVEAKERFDMVLRRVDSVASELTELRRALATESARIDGEVHAIKRAVARCSATVSRTDAIANALQADLVDRIRAQIGEFEQRLNTELSRQRAEIATEVGTREKVTASLADCLRRSEDAIDARLRACELATSRRAPPILEPPKEYDRDAPDVASLQQLVELEARIDEESKATSARLMQEVARAAAVAVERDDELQLALDKEKEERQTLETTVGTTIEAAVRKVARATQAELTGLDSRLEAVDDKLTKASDASRREANGRLRLLEAELRQVRATTVPEMRRVVECSTSELRAWFEERCDAESGGVSSRLDGMQRIVDSAKHDLTDWCAKAAAERAAERAAQTASTETAMKITCEMAANGMQKDIARIRAECLGTSAARMSQARKEAEDASEMRLRAVERRLLGEIDDHQTELDVRHCVYKMVDTVVDLGHRRAMVSASERRQRNSTRCAETVTATATVLTADLADHYSSLFEAKLEPLLKTLQGLCRRVDAQSAEILSLRRDVEAIQEHHLPAQAARGGDGLQALAAASRTQLVTAIRNVLKTCSEDADKTCQATVVAEVARHHRSDQAQLRGIVDRVTAIEATLDPMAWRDTVRDATAALVASSSDLRFGYDDDQPTGSETTAAVAVQPLLQSHVRSIFPRSPS